MSAKLFLTTSWDDGHPLAFRIADLLERYGLTGTFYVPRRSQREVMTAARLRDLSCRFEIGSHTIDHLRLDLLSDQEARRQLEGSRSWIEDVTGKECQVFCFPSGKFRPSQLSLVREVGFIGARTVELLSLQWPNAKGSLRLIPTTVQAYPHPWTNYLRNALRRGAFRGFFRARRCLFSRDWTSLGRTLFEHGLERGGVFHLWGHCWEVEQEKQWNALEQFLAYVSEWKEPLRILTNSELCATET